MSEEWRDVVGYEGIYKVSNFGRIIRSYVYSESYKKRRKVAASKDKMLKLSKDKHGYLRVALSNGKPKTTKVHKIVALAFLGNLNNKKYVIDHINRDKTDNRVENLRWVSISENTRNSDKIDNSKSKYNCVYQSNNGYIARIREKDKNTYLGYFKTEDEAAHSVDKYIIENGLDRVLNFI